MARMLLAQLGAAPVMMSLLYGVSLSRFPHIANTVSVENFFFFSDRNLMLARTINSAVGRGPHY